MLVNSTYSSWISNGAESEGKNWQYYSSLQACDLDRNEEDVPTQEKRKLIFLCFVQRQAAQRLELKKLLG